MAYTLFFGPWSRQSYTASEFWTSGFRSALKCTYNFLDHEAKTSTETVGWVVEMTNGFFYIISLPAVSKCFLLRRYFFGGGSLFYTENSGGLCCSSGQTKNRYFCCCRWQFSGVLCTALSTLCLWTLILLRVFDCVRDREAQVLFICTCMFMTLKLYMSNSAMVIIGDQMMCLI